MASPNLNIVHVVTAQSKKEDTINDGFDQLDQAMNDTFQITVSSTAHTVSSTDFDRSACLDLIGSPTAFFLDVPAVSRVFLVDNGTSVNASVRVVGGGGTSGIVISGLLQWVKCDGTDVKLVP